MAGIDYLRAMVDGELPQPPIAGLMQFEIVSGRPGPRGVHLPARRIGVQPDRRRARRAGLHAARLGDRLRDAQHAAAGQGLHLGRDQGELPQGGPAGAAACSPRPERSSRRARGSASPKASSPTPPVRWSRRPPARCWCSTCSRTRYVRRVAQQFVVIGAGIAGLATAVALQRRGHDVTILEGRSDTTSGRGNQHLAQCPCGA